MGVAPNRLHAFCDGETDLRELVVTSSSVACYTTAVMPIGPGDELRVEPFQGSLESSGFLPEPGFVLDDLPSADLVDRTDERNLLLELVLDAPGRIAVGAFTDLVHQVHVLAKHALAGIKGDDDDWHWKDGVFDMVVAAAPGSFRVLLETSGRQTPEFNARMSEALRGIDTLFKHSEDPAKVFGALVEHHARVSAAYLKLLQLLNKNETGLRYAWTSGEARGIHSGKVSRQQAKSLAEALIKDRHSGKVFEREGELYRCNSRTGSWGLTTAQGRLFGKARLNDQDLTGLRLGGRYKFTCRLEYDLTLDHATVYLVRHEPLSREAPLP